MLKSILTTVGTPSLGQIPLILEMSFSGTTRLPLPRARKLSSNVDDYLVSFS